MKISQLLYKEDRWMKGGMARTKTGNILQNLNIYHYQNGKELNPASECVAYSLYGAASCLYSNEGLSDVLIRLGDAARKYTGKAIYLAAFNDAPETNFNDVKKVLEIANL